MALSWSPVTIPCPAAQPTLGLKCDTDLRGSGDWGAESELLLCLNRPWSIPAEHTELSGGQLFALGLM